eukprot:gene12592-10589_t
MTRPFKGKTPDHYTFDPSGDATIAFIAAVGSSPVFAYGKAAGELLGRGSASARPPRASPLVLVLDRALGARRAPTKGGGGRPAAGGAD